MLSPRYTGTRVLTPGGSVTVPGTTDHPPALPTLRRHRPSTFGSPDRATIPGFPEILLAATGTSPRFAIHRSRADVPLKVRPVTVLA